MSEPQTTKEYITYCNGCAGRGWVDSKVTGPTLCPVCKGDGLGRGERSHIKETTYDQDAIWIELRKGTHESFDEILEKETKKISDNSEILVHLLFDRDITPQGNLIFHHLQHQTITGGKVPELSRDEVVARNYCTDENGKIETWEGVPVSPAIRDLINDLDADERIHTCKVDVNRKGNPHFCDENMLAFSFVIPGGTDVKPFLKDIQSLFRKKHHTEIVNLSLYLLA